MEVSSFESRASSSEFRDSTLKLWIDFQEPLCELETRNYRLDKGKIKLFLVDCKIATIDVHGPKILLDLI